ncbi:MAG: hypothetical protein FWH22_09695, partial [Fibromonadales bacterium]|nr:hypothetical protein [Fibromonadales bacterium]
EGKYTFRAGSGIGLRYFPSGTSDGLYLQIMTSAHYYSIKYKEGYYYLDGGEPSNKPKKGTSADALLYIGRAYKYHRVNIFSDIGIGLGYAKHNEVFYDNNVAFEANLGIGLPF